MQTSSHMSNKATSHSQVINVTWYNFL